MILQALNAYYERLAGEDGSEIPLRGFSRQPVPYAIELSTDGTLSQVLDLRDHSRKKQPALLVLPAPLKMPGTGFSANFLWDNTRYALGADAKDNPERAEKCFQSFRDRLDEVGSTLTDEGFLAVKTFLAGWLPDRIHEFQKDWNDMVGRNVVFRLSGETRFVHERPAVRACWLRYYEANASEDNGQCLVTGETGPVARTHTPIKGVVGGQTSGGAIVSFNQRAFESYGKDCLQGLNAPVSEAATFNYTTALNDLLKTGSRQKILICDATTVFWTDRKTATEGLLGMVLNPREDQGDLADLRLFLQAVRDGKMPERLADESRATLHVLGLAPSTARVSIRFWHVDSVDGIWRKIGRHFEDLRIVKSRETDPDFPSMRQLLRTVAKLEDLDNLSPLLAGAFMRSILAGSAYPAHLLASLIGRIRADQKIGYLRAALIKACLVRNARLAGQTPEVLVSLDESSVNPAYRLGRLFAVLEKLQQDALGNPNTTIKDRYFGSASATPRSVFPVLLRLAQHHCAKSEYGRASDNRIAQILDGLDNFPAHLSLENQGLFALGYYHQRTSLWTKNTAAKTSQTSTEQPS